MGKADVSDAFVLPAQLESTRAERRRILVVDDDDDLRAAVRDVLEAEGLSVVEARNGSAALEYLLGTKTMPSLILLDMNMPIMSGREMLSVLRDHLRFSKIPVLLVTSEAPGHWPERGTVGRLQKPFRAEELLARVLRYRAGIS